MEERLQRYKEFQAQKAENRRVLEQDRALLKAHPELFAKFPIRPKKRFMVTSELMHFLVFKAVERIVSDDDIQELVKKQVAATEVQEPETADPVKAEEN